MSHEHSTLRAYAGAICAMTHGMLRWSDIQRSQDLRLTADVVAGRAAMKNQMDLTPWACTRQGFLDMDWGAPWMAALSEASLPGLDFVLFGISDGLKKFRHSVADYKDMLHFVRISLQRPPFSLTEVEANTYTVHSFRHVYNTSMRQLNVRSDNIEDAGHWKRGSAMALTYDSAECVLELQTKEAVRAAVAAGWRRVGDACLPQPALPPQVCQHLPHHEG